MKQRSHQAWQDLVKLQAEGQLSILEFCKQQKISTSCFYKHKAIYRAQPPSTTKSFIKAEFALQNNAKVEPIRIQHGKTRIHLPTSVQSLWLAELIKALA